MSHPGFGGRKPAVRKHVTIFYMLVIVFSCMPARGTGNEPMLRAYASMVAAAYVRSGRQDDANWEAEQVLALNPDFSLQCIRQAFPFNDPADMERFLDGLRIAGIEQ
jgi:hypothetical protein